jgi:hypothetical protein
MKEFLKELESKDKDELIKVIKAFISCSNCHYSDSMFSFDCEFCDDNYSKWKLNKAIKEK